MYKCLWEDSTEPNHVYFVVSEWNSKHSVKILNKYAFQAKQLWDPKVQCVSKLEQGPSCWFTTHNRWCLFAEAKTTAR